MPFRTAKPESDHLAVSAPQPSIHQRAIRTARNTFRQLLKGEIAKSKRKGYWFRLGLSDRSYLGLALRLNLQFRSQALIRSLVKVLKRLKEAGDTAYTSLMGGMRMAWAFSEAAVSWGNEGAKEWRNDARYIRYLARCVAAESCG